MAVTAPVSFGKIQIEFGALTNTFSDLVRGGTWVDDNPTTASVSTTASGLALGQFLGAEDQDLGGPGDL